MSEKTVLELCQEGIERWQDAFNSGDAAACAQQYVEDAVMEARPFGTFSGRKEIQDFWQGIIDQGFTDVQYTNVSWLVVDKIGYILTAEWTMNKAFGVVHREHWAVDVDGKARLLADDFEVQGER